MSPMSVYLDAALRANASLSPRHGPDLRRPRLDVDPVHRRAGGCLRAACLCAGFAVARAGDIEEWIRLAVVDLGGGPHLATLDEGDSYLRFRARRPVASPNSSSRSASAPSSSSSATSRRRRDKSRPRTRARAPSPVGPRLDHRHPPGDGP